MTTTFTFEPMNRFALSTTITWAKGKRTTSRRPPRSAARSRPETTPSVATQEPGLVSEIAATEGAQVKQGDLLARLDSHGLEIELRDLTAQEQVATALIEERRVELSWRQRDLETYRALSQREASNPKELYDAEAQLNIAKARHAAAERQLTVTRAKAERLQKRIDDMLIKAPFDGEVASRSIDPGAFVRPGTSLVSLM